MAKVLGGSKATEFSLVSNFKLGYRNREDITTLPPGVLVTGSKNVLTNTSGRIANRKGYTLYGGASGVNAPILASWDGVLKQGTETHLRAGFLISNDGKLQYQYTDSTGTVTWRDLLTGLTSTNFNFTSWWDKNNAIQVVLGVNGTSNIYEWSGGVTTYASSTTTTITKQGTTTWAEENFYSIGNGHQSVVINGITYSYSGGAGTTTLTGVTPDPTAGGHVAGNVVHQGVITRHNVVYDQTQTTQNATQAFGETDATGKPLKIGQSFVPAYIPGYLYGVEIYKTADTGTFVGDVTLSIFADGAGSPTGSALATSTITNSSWINGSAIGFVAFPFATPLNIVPSFTYWIVMSVTNNTDANHPNLGTNSAGGYASGSVKYNNTADGWVAISTIDLAFKTISDELIGIPPEFANQLIATFQNQLYLGSLSSTQIYVSKIGNYLDFSFTSPVSAAAEGAKLFLDSFPTAFIVQEDKLYFTGGLSDWYSTEITLSSDLQSRTILPKRLKTTFGQAAQSQYGVTKIKNNVVFLSNEPIINSLGRVDNVVLTPQITDLSYTIINDMNAYDFTDAALCYYRNFLYVAVPAESVVRVYNMTDVGSTSAAGVLTANHYWEAPLTIPIGRFSIINGELYGHGYATSDTYKLFDGYNDNGAPIQSSAYFSFKNEGIRFASKSCNEYYVEGYISSNTALNLGIQYDIDGCATITSYPISGSDTQIVCIGSNSSAPLGKSPLGKNSLGSASVSTGSVTGLPPKFRVIKTFPRVPFYEQQTSFTSSGVDLNWEIIAFGGATILTPEGNNPITQ